jgi:hypothetical protein
MHISIPDKHISLPPPTITYPPHNVRCRRPIQHDDQIPLPHTPQREAEPASRSVEELSLSKPAQLDQVGCLWSGFCLERRGAESGPVLLGEVLVGAGVSVVDQAGFVESAGLVSLVG